MTDAFPVETRGPDRPDLTGTGGKATGTGRGHGQLEWRFGEAHVIASLDAHPEVHRWAGALYPDARIPPSPRDGPHPPDLRLIRTPGGLVLEGGAAQGGPLTPSEAFVATELEVTRRLLERQPHLPLHGAAISGSSGALLLVGSGEAGKSTVTALLAREGYAVFGDDALLVDGKGRIHPFPRLLKLSEPARSLHFRREELPTPHRFPLTEATLLHPGELGTGWAKPDRPGTVVFLEREPGMEGMARWHSIGGGEAMRLLMAQRLFHHRDPGEDFRTLAAAIASARTLAVRYRNAAQILGELRGHLGPPGMEPGPR